MSGIDLRQAPSVPETVLQRRKVREKKQALRASRALRKEAWRSRSKSGGAAPGAEQRFRTPESIVFSHRAAIRNERIAARLQKESGNVRRAQLDPHALPRKEARKKSADGSAAESGLKPNVILEDRSNVLFALRLGGFAEQNIPLRQKRLLIALRLRSVNHGVFLKLNVTNLGLLRKVGNYVTYGVPSVALIRRLVQKRGFVMAPAGDALDVGELGAKDPSRHVRTPLSDNRLVEDALGELGILVVEDVVQEIASGGDNFDAASAFLLPFKLSHAKAGRTQRRLRPEDYRPFEKGGKMGYRGGQIDELLSVMC